MFECIEFLYMIEIYNLSLNEPSTLHDCVLVFIFRNTTCAMSGELQDDIYDMFLSLNFLVLLLKLNVGAIVLKR